MMMMFHAGGKCIINKRQRLSRLPQDVCLRLAPLPPAFHLPRLLCGCEKRKLYSFSFTTGGKGERSQAAGGVAASGNAVSLCVCLCVCVQGLLAVFNFIAKENEARTKQEQKKMRGNLGAQMKPKAKDTAWHSLCAKLGTLAHPSSQPASQPATPGWQLTSQGPPPNPPPAG